MEQSEKGFSFVELMLALGLVAVLLSIAIPNFTRYIAKIHLQDVARLLVDELTLARHQASYTNDDIYMSFVAGSQWCFGRSSGNDCNCKIAKSCNFSNVDGSAYGNIQLLLPTGMPQNHLQFGGFRNLPQQIALAQGKQEIVLQNSYQDSVTVTISGLGRIEMCGTGALGVPACQT